MKRVVLPMLMALAINVATAQVPNSSFENWSSGSPDGWATTNDADLMMFPITRVAGYEGMYAVRGEVIDFQGAPVLIPPSMLTGPDGEGFPVSARYQTITGYYKYSPLGGDRLVVGAALRKGGNDSVGVGAAFLQAASVFTKFVCPISYTNNETADTCTIAVSIFGPSGGADYHKGSAFEIDAIGMSENPSATEESPLKDCSLAISPNPLTSSGRIEYEIPQEYGGAAVSLVLYDALGREAATLLRLDAQQPGGYMVPAWEISAPAGVYRCELRVGHLVVSMPIHIVR